MLAGEFELVLAVVGHAEVVVVDRRIAAEPDRGVQQAHGASAVTEPVIHPGQGVEKGRLLQLLEGLGQRQRTAQAGLCLLYTSPSPRDRTRSRMPSSA